MNPLTLAFANLLESEQVLVVEQYFSGKLFGFVAEANASATRRRAAQKELAALRKTKLLLALPASEQVRLNELFADAENLLRDS